MPVSGPKIKKRIPGPKAKAIIERDRKVLVTSTKAGPLVVKRAEGAIIEDVDGNILIDLFSGIGVLNIGHRNPKVLKAIREQSEKFVHVAGTDFYYDIQVKLAERLAAIAPGKQKRKVFYTNSGTEAIEAGIKVAKSYTGRQRFVGFVNAFHGRTMGSLDLTASKPVHKQGFFPFMPGTYHIPYAYCFRCRYKLQYPDCDLWCARILDEVYFDTHLPPEDVAAIFAEPVQGEGGYVVPPKEFLPLIKKIVSKHGILYVDDEIQAGIGRTGKFWAIEHFGVVPDMIASSKALGSGIPIGALIIDEKLDFERRGMHSSTFGGNPIGAAAALATLDVVRDEKLLNRASKLGKESLKRLQEMQKRYEIVGDARGIGLMLAHEFVENKKTLKTNEKARDKVADIALKKGLAILGCGKSSMRYVPPLTINEDLLTKAWDILEDSIKKVDRGN